MITLYHGGSDIIKEPEIRIAERTLDFGTGFYTTSSKTQAENLVRNRIARMKWPNGYVNAYNFEQTDELLKIKQFEGPTEEWVDFVLSNRVEEGFTHDFDIVIGPVANDNVYRQFAFFENGLISKKSLIDELMTYKLVDQYLFHTERSLKCLTFFGSEKIEKHESN